MPDPRPWRGDAAGERCARRATRGPPAGHARAPGRQVDLAPGAPARAARGGREHDRGGRRRRGRPLDGGASIAALGGTRGADRATTAAASTTASSRPGGAALAEPEGVLDCGNSGTTTRLVAGTARRRGLFAVLDGDASLRRRPMGRVIEPLRAMGAIVRGPPAATRCCRSRSRGRATWPPSTTTRPSPAPRSSRRSCWPGLAADGETTRDRGGRHPRPHRADAPRPRHRGARRRPAPTAPHTVAPRRARRAPAAIDGDGALRTRPAPRSGWSPAAIHPDAELRLEGVEHEPDPACHHRHPQAHGRRHRGDRSTGPGEEPTASPSRTSWSGPATSGASTCRPPTWRRRSTRSRSSPWPRATAAGTHPDPRGRGAPPQGVRPDRRDRGRAQRPGRARARRGRRHRDRGRRAPHGRRHRDPRRSPARDDVRDRRPHRRWARPSSTGPGRRRSPTPASSTNSKGCEHDEARRPHRPPGGPLAVRRDAAGGLRHARHRRRVRALGPRARSRSPRPSPSCATDDFLGANVTIPHKERVVPHGRPADRGGARDRRGQHDHQGGQASSSATTPTCRASRSPSTSSSAARRCRARPWCWAPAAARARSSTG